VAVLRFHDHRLIASGEIGYDQAGDFARLCERFMLDHRAMAGIIDLSGATMLVSPCVTAIYEDARSHKPAGLKIIVRKNMAPLFAPGEVEGLFVVEEV
jgi:hypothetical protein